jgi:hypothetical protein
MKNIHILLIALFSVAGSSIVLAEQESYIVGNNAFLEIKDVHRQSESWAMCAATYDLMADIVAESEPARSNQLRDYANGAELAVLISIVADGLGPDINPEKFDALWSSAKVTGSELPKTRYNMLLAEAESASKSDAAPFLEKLAATMRICASNLDAQQAYIDIWRELAKSGLLQMPKN